VTVVALTDLVARLRESPARAGSTRVLAIDGRGGSGKTMLADRLASLLEAPVVHMDDLFPGWDGLAAAAPILRRWVLEPLARGGAARHRRYDWSRDAYGGWVDVPPSDTLVVEGCACGSRLAAPYLSLLFWIDAPRKVRFDRGIRRDGETFRPHWERWALQEDALFAAEGTRERADYRVDGAPSVPHDPEHEVVLLP
jgi:cytidylate kinase